MATAEDDPFACFDSDSDVPNEKDPASNRKTYQVECVRNPEYGVLALHAGTEHALLAHVRNDLRQAKPPNRLQPEAVLESIDRFCLQRHWMMHVGPEKGKLLEAFLKECLARRRSMGMEAPGFTLVELGTYCGYSAILWAKTLQDEGFRDFHVYTVDVNRANASVANSLIELAGLPSCISVLILDIEHDQKVCELLAEKGVIQGIDLLFLDHDKDAYLQDLQELEEMGMIRQHTHVAADNVVFASIENYRNYIEELASRGVVETMLVEVPVEYCGPDRIEANNQESFRDGIGKVSLPTSFRLSAVVSC
jgi:catechol O-methyltransferase